MAIAHTEQLVEFDEDPTQSTAITRSESALADLLSFAERLHRSRIEHDPVSCLVCFEGR